MKRIQPSPRAMLSIPSPTSQQSVLSDISARLSMISRNKRFVIQKKQTAIIQKEDESHKAFSSFDWIMNVSNDSNCGCHIKDTYAKKQLITSAYFWGSALRRVAFSPSVFFRERCCKRIFPFRVPLWRPWCLPCSRYRD